MRDGGREILERFDADVHTKILNEKLMKGPYNFSDFRVKYEEVVLLYFYQESPTYFFANRHSLGH